MYVMSKFENSKSKIKSKKARKTKVGFFVKILVRGAGGLFKGQWEWVSLS